MMPFFFKNRITIPLFIGSNEGAAPVRCGEEGAEPEGEAFKLLLHLCSNPHLCSQIWVLTQRMRLWIQAAEMSFLQRGTGLSLRDRGRSSTIWKELGVEPLLLHIERSRLRWFIWLGCLLVAFLWSFFRPVQLGEGPRADLELTGGILCPI